ncbi:phage tail protein [Corallococcus terminator]
MPPARASARASSRAPARGAAPARAGATSAAAPGGAAIKVGGDAEKDPRFRKVIEQLKKSSDKTKKHPPASQKAAEAQAAAVSPPTEQLAGAKGNQVDAMKAAEAPKTEPNGFLAMLRAEIEKVMPKTLDDADSFMEGNETAQVKDSVAGGVSETKQAATGPTEAATAAAPDPSGVPARQSSEMPSEPAPESLPVNGAEAMPAPKPNTQVQALQKGKQDADQQMKDAELTPDQLKKANDPRFSKVISEKGQVEKTAGAAPGKYRASETGTLGQAKAKAGGDARAGVAQMAGVRVSGNSKVKTRQLLAKQKDEARRKEVTSNIERMYQQTKQRVDSRLSTLEADVMRMFDLGAEAALSDMKSYADREIEKFKDDRYSGLTGKARWVADLFRPVPEGIKVILGQARTRFASKMDALAVRISTAVDNRLAQAKADVDKGQAAIKTYVDSLPRDLQGVGQEAQKAVGERFDELRSGIDAKKNDLAQKLAQKYKEAFDKADAALKKLEEENAGALKKLADAIGEVIKILTEFKDKLMALLRKGWETIKLILADPIGFLSNLISAIKLGVQQFLGNIKAHLIRGFMTWLFGALAQAGIPIPTDLTLPSILKLVLAVLGITYERMRAKAVKLLGERTVGLLEKVFELVRTLITSGPAAMWEQMKENLGNLKDMVIEALKSWLIETVVKQAITKIISMFNPAGAIIQAVLAIYNTVMFFIERASQIMSLIEAIISSVHAIATGAIGGAANWIEQALGRAVPVVISFLARLIGLGGISDKIKETILKVQGMVDRAIDKVLAKLVALARKLFGKAKGAGPESQVPVAERWKNGMAALDSYLAADRGKEKRIGDLKKGLAPLKSRFGFTKLEVVRQGAGVAVDAEMNPKQLKGVSDKGLIDEDYVKTVRPEGAKGDVRYEWKTSARGAEHFYCVDSENTEWHWRKKGEPKSGTWIASAQGRKQQKEAEAAATAKVKADNPKYISIVSEEKALTHSGLDVAGLAPGATPAEDRVVIGEAKFLGGKKPQSVKYVPPEQVGTVQPSGRTRENPLSATTDNLQTNLANATAAQTNQETVKRVEGALKAGRVEVIYFLAGQATIPAAKLARIAARIRAELASYLKANFAMKDDEVKLVVANVIVRVEKI